MDKMTFREACKTDIEQIQLVRNAVKENTLSNPALITDADCLEFMTNRGKGWVCEIDEKIVGFSIADLIGNNIWIGAKVTLLDGSKVGDNSVIAAGAVVSGVFPNNVVIGGVPAKILKTIE